MSECKLLPYERPHYFRLNSGARCSKCTTTRNFEFVDSRENAKVDLAVQPDPIHKAACNECIYRRRIRVLNHVRSMEK